MSVYRTVLCRNVRVPNCPFTKKSVSLLEWTDGRTFQKVLRRNNLIIAKVWNTSKIKLISKKVVSVYEMKVWRCPYLSHQVCRPCNVYFCLLCHLCHKWHKFNNNRNLAENSVNGLHIEVLVNCCLRIPKCTQNLHINNTFVDILCPISN